MKKNSTYLDNASTTPLDKEVLKAMLPYMKEKWGNPSNLYTIGRTAKQAIYESTKKIADVLQSSLDEFVFTGSATEADNLALAGIARANKNQGNRLIISSIEHKGIMAVAEALKKEGFEIIYIPVGKDGLIDLEALKAAMNDKTILVSVTMADSETGTIQPIKEIAKIIKRFKKIPHPSGTPFKKGDSSILPYFHTDASQAAAHSEINVNKLGVDLMTLSAHKLGGPMGIGGLYIRRGTSIQPIIYGGGQQGRIRSGTENVPAIVGFGKAMEIAHSNLARENMRITKLRDTLEHGLFKKIPKIVLNGHKTKRLPNFLNVSILDVEGEALLLHLDEYGIMINTGSACNSESLEPSYVLTAIGNPYEFVHGSIRFTLGRISNKKDIDYVLKYLPNIVKELRAISPLDLSLDQKSNMSDPKAFMNNQTPHFLRKKKKTAEVSPPKKP